MKKLLFIILLFFSFNVYSQTITTDDKIGLLGGTMTFINNSVGGSMIVSIGPAYVDVGGDGLGFNGAFRWALSINKIPLLSTIPFIPTINFNGDKDDIYTDEYYRWNDRYSSGSIYTPGYSWDHQRIKWGIGVIFPIKIQEICLLVEYDTFGRIKVGIAYNYGSLF